jgi:hypothetical protein
MKKFIKIFSMVVTAWSVMTGCDDFLTVDPQDSIVAENYYTSETAVRQNTASLYSRVWWDFHSQFMWLAGDELAGDLYYTYDAEGQFYYNAVGAGNRFNDSGWTGLYRVVSYANSIINDMPSAARENGISEAVIDRALAEARFVRAVAYYYIAECWDEAPIIENASEKITSGNPSDMFVNKHTKSSIYRFICEDLEFAAGVLPETDDQAGRATKWSALGMLARAYVTRGAYENNADYYAKAKDYAGQVIENSGLALYPDYSTMFDVVANNSSESLFAIQCMVGEYSAGSSRNVNFSRGSRIADQTWGAGKGPTISLQEQYSANDGRRKWVYMTHSDYYPNLAKAEGGYTYYFVYCDPSDYDTEIESANEMLAHIKKYVIGKASDNGGQVGQNQDAANNIYLLRLSDVYFLYAEASMGTSMSTTDQTALAYINEVLDRGNAGYQLSGTLTYEQLIKERRKEFAFESVSWFDIKRYYYRDHEAALSYLNNMKRDRVYSFDWDNIETGSRTGEELRNTTNGLYNDRKNYVQSWETRVNPNITTPDESNRVNNIVFTAASMTMALPSEVTTQAPVLLEDAVDYYNE